MIQAFKLESFHVSEPPTTQRHDQRALDRAFELGRLRGVSEADQTSRQLLSERLKALQDELCTLRDQAIQTRANDIAALSPLIEAAVDLLVSESKGDWVKRTLSAEIEKLVDAAALPNCRISASMEMLALLQELAPELPQAGFDLIEAEKIDIRFEDGRLVFDPQEVVQQLRDSLCDLKEDEDQWTA